MEEELNAVHLEFHISDEHKITYKLIHFPNAVLMWMMQEVSELVYQDGEWLEINFEEKHFTRGNSEGL